MNLIDEKYIIVEIIPTASTPEKGKIIQLSALKLDGLNLIDRFDYRLEEKKLPIPEMIDWINYDKEIFNYVNDDKLILEEFDRWSEKLPILVLDKIYTPNFLNKLSNKIIPILAFLKEDYSEDIIEKLINKYNLEPSNYIVDLLYECLIQRLS